MQSDWKEVYRLTSKRTEKSEQMYKDIGNFIFNKLYTELRRPKSLIIKLKGIGFWYLRKKRIQAIVDIYPPNFDKKPEDFNHPLELLKHENKVEIYNIFKERLKEYEEYIIDRDKVRKIRHENQPLLESSDEEDTSN